MRGLQPTGQQFVPTSISYLTLSILEVPIGDYLHCSHFIAEKSSNAKVLLSALVVVATVDLHVAASLLQICGSYCKLFDEEVRRCFSTCIAVDISDDHWQQAPLSLSFGGLGFDLYLITLLLLSSPSLASSIFGSDSNHLVSAI